MTNQVHHHWNLRSVHFQNSPTVISNTLTW